MIPYKKKYNHGFASIAEVIVSALIFAIASVGILATITAIQPHVAESSKRLKAIYIAKGAMEELYQYVDANTWDSAGEPLEVDITHMLTYGDYNVIYRVTDVAGLDLRALQMNVTYP